MNEDQLLYQYALRQWVAELYTKRRRRLSDRRAVARRTTTPGIAAVDGLDRRRDERRDTPRRQP